MLWAGGGREMQEGVRLGGNLKYGRHDDAGFFGGTNYWGQQKMINDENRSQHNTQKNTKAKM